MASFKAKGQEISKEEEESLFQEIKGKYDKQLSPYYAAARLWVDGIINPVHTRSIISKGIEVAANNPNMPPYNVGVIQT